MPATVHKHIYYHIILIMKPSQFFGIANLQKSIRQTHQIFQTIEHKRQSKSARLEHLLIPNRIQNSTTKSSSNQNGLIAAYAANTNQGIVRNYNEDRVTIILNFLKPKEKDIAYWPRCSFFGLYDGHGGSECADFLRDFLHHFVRQLLDIRR